MDHLNSMLVNDIVIIGGGLAGLSAVWHLKELGACPLIIEAGSYPSHKICGEFFSPESTPILNRFGITPSITINQFTLISPYKQLHFTFPQPAVSMSHFTFDHLLVQKARHKGVDILEQHTVQAIEKKTDENLYALTLSSGETIKARQLIIGAGRVTALLHNQLSSNALRYVGIKAHFQGTLPCKDQVFFYTFPGGAYAGLSMVDHNTINIACLARKELVEKEKSIDAFMHKLAGQPHAQDFSKVIKDHTQHFPWLSCAVPNFGLKQTPDLDQVYFIGDAAGTIPPACGDGLALALATGEMVASYVLTNDAAGFKKAWQRKYGPILRNGIMLHEMMMRPWLTNTAITLGNYFPSLISLVFNKTRLKK